MISIVVVSFNQDINQVKNFMLRFYVHFEIEFPCC